MNIFKAVTIGNGIFWVGNPLGLHGLHSNPYLIIEGDEAVLIDGGSRPDFSSVMIKIMEAGVNPSQISKLIYHHYDPDLCGSISNFEEVIKRPGLEILSHRYNNLYIDHYSTSVPKRCVEELDFQWVFQTGRVLRFFMTPYAHAPGSFITYDQITKTLFTSDIFGCALKNWTLFFEPTPDCRDCDAFANQPVHEDCYFAGLRKFHEHYMPSTDALYSALDMIAKLDIETIAPQHGQIISGRENVQLVIQRLRSLECVGMDRLIRKGGFNYEPGSDR